MASETLHEDPARLEPETIDRHRAIASVMEELEAVDWYDQRIRATDDAEPRAIFAHNRDEEKKHAAMVLEWLRGRDAVFAQQLRICQRRPPRAATPCSSTCASWWTARWCGHRASKAAL
jgi:hypothetical protein